MELHNHKCTACNVVWAKLATQEQVDEKYEFCPLCRSDLYLIPSYEAGFQMCPLTMKITDSKGEVIYPEPPAPRRTYVPEGDKYLIGKMVEYKKIGTQEERDARADAIIEKHLNG